MTTPQLFPKPPKRIRQPLKSVLRDQLRISADRIMELAAENETLRAPWWLRIWRSKWTRG